MRSWLAKWLDLTSRPDTTCRRVNFVILFPGRTGSSHLISCMTQHPQIAVDGEKLVRLGAEEQRAYLDARYTADLPSAVTAAGFKTKLKDVASLQEFAACLTTHQVRIITLVRANRVKLAVSTLNARRIHAQHGRWNLVKGESQLPPLNASVDEILTTIANVDEAQQHVVAFARQLPLPRLELTYEELLQDHEATIARLEAFLEVDARPLTGSVAKATEDDLRKSVVAYDTLESRLRGTIYECDLVDNRHETSHSPEKARK